MGLKILDEDELSEINDKLKGWILFIDGDKTKFVYILGSIEEFYKHQQYLSDAKKAMSNAEKLRNLLTHRKINILFFTKHYHESFQKISRYYENPLLPKDVLFLLGKIKYDGKFNLLLNLEEILLDHIQGYDKLLEQNNISFDSVSSLNRNSYIKFEQKRFEHKDDILQLRGTIRKYLRIDEKW